MTLAVFAAAALLAGAAAPVLTSTPTREPAMPIVRLAQPDIDPALLDAYRAEPREEIKASFAQEPGVLTLYAVAETDRPQRLHLMEIYANQAAYTAHIASPHFVKYKAATREMVLSLTLTDATPVLLQSKPAGVPAF